MINKKVCVYTVLFGDYEKLNEQPVYKNSELDFICFTDNKNLTSESWKLIHCEPVFQSDVKRSSRFPKIVPHRYLQNYDLSLYIDNSVRLNRSPEIILNDLFQYNYDIALFTHSFRETVLDEFNEVARLGYDKLDIVAEQLHAYEISSPQILKQRPFNGGFIIRKHNKPSVIAAMEDWLAQVLRYSRRDQLSLNFILEKHDINVLGINMDIRKNPYLQWPIVTRYGSPEISVSKGNNKIDKQKTELVDYEKKIQVLNSQLADLQKEVIHYNLSWSWRITRPFRKFMRIIRGKRNDH